MKSKLQLVDIHPTLKDFVELLKSKSQVFTLGRYKISYTSDQRFFNLDESTIVKTRDFCDNYSSVTTGDYTFTLESEASNFRIFTLRKANGIAGEDHITFISNG